MTYRLIRQYVTINIFFFGTIKPYNEIVLLLINREYNPDSMKGVILGKYPH